MAAKHIDSDELERLAALPAEQLAHELLDNADTRLVLSSIHGLLSDKKETNQATLTDNVDIQNKGKRKNFETSMVVPLPGKVDKKAPAWPFKLSDANDTRRELRIRRADTRILEKKAFKRSTLRACAASIAAVVILWGGYTVGNLVSEDMGQDPTGVRAVSVINSSSTYTATPYDISDICNIASSLNAYGNRSKEPEHKKVNFPLGTAADYRFLQQMSYLGVDIGIMEMIDISPYGRDSEFMLSDLDTACSWSMPLRNAEELRVLLWSNVENVDLDTVILRAIWGEIPVSKDTGLDITVANVPLPASLIMLLTGLCGFIVLQLCRHR